MKKKKVEGFEVVMNDGSKEEFLVIDFPNLITKKEYDRIKHLFDVKKDGEYSAKGVF